MPFWAGDTDLRQVVSSQFRGAFSLYRAVYRAPPVGGSRLRHGGRSGEGAVEEAADDLAGGLVAVALVELVQRIPAGDQAVQLEPALLVQAQQHRDVTEGVAGSEQRALDALLEHRGQLAAEGDVPLLRAVGQGREHQRSALAQRGRRARVYLGGHLPDGHDD